MLRSKTLPTAKHGVKRTGNADGKADGHSGGNHRGAAVDPVDAYLRSIAATVDKLSREEIWTAVDILVAAAMKGRRIYIIGNGGSAATASHMAVDLNKQASLPGGPLFRAHALTDNMPLITAWANDDDFGEVFRQQLANHLEPGDVVVAISTSGNSKNVLRALELARAVGAPSIGLTGSTGGAMCQLADHCVFVPCNEIGQQESIHLAVDHAITIAIRERLTSGT